jgi:hypothetical protein
VGDASRGSGRKERGTVLDMKDIQMVMYTKEDFLTIKLMAREHITGVRMKVILGTGTKE